MLAKLEQPRQLLALCLLAMLQAGACTSSLAETPGDCVTDQALDCSVSFSRDGSDAKPVGLIGYACSGSARPDQDPRYLEEVPSGLVCASRGVTPDGKQSYCCSPNDTPCAYNPVARCDFGDGYQCRGSSRPEALNPAIKCGNGVRQDQYINYCCSGEPGPSECLQVNTLGCSERLTGFSCPGATLPKGEELGASESRADYYRPLCPTPTPSANVTRSNYCCYMPALIPPGASCVQDTVVPGCAPGRFGFACYGPDTPDQDYTPMSCPDPGVAGKSAEGYPAKLYCCDFR